MSATNICGQGTGTQAAAVTAYYTCGQGSNNQAATTETDVQSTWRTAGVISNLWYRVILNSLSGTATLRIRKNTANGNSVISVGAGLTGAFEDTTNTETIVAGDILNYSLVTAAGTGTIQGDILSFLFTATIGTLTRPVCGRAVGRTYATASTTYFEMLYGLLSGGTVEAVCQQKFLLSASMKNMFVRVLSNARSTATTVRNRIAGANGTLTVSITASTSGVFEDTTHTDAIVSGNLLNTSIVTGTGTGNLLITVIAYDITTTTNLTHAFAGGATGAVTTSLTRYSPFSGVAQTDATESNVQLKSGMACQLSNLSVNVETNTIIDASTLRLRKNGTNGNQSISITGLTTGYFEDSTNKDSVIETDLVNLSLVTGATGTSINIDSYGIKISTVAYGKQTVMGQAVNRGSTY